MVFGVAMMFKPFMFTSKFGFETSQVCDVLLLQDTFLRKLSHLFL